MTNLQALTSLLGPPESSGRFFGVTVGVVTDNRDPDDLGRVKVKFPWLSDRDESNWARVVAPMAGKGRGAFFLPEPDDEVLVAFEHGRAEFPYVLGGLWNGLDKAPESNTDGKNNHRTIKSRAGMVLRFDDTPGAEKIEILDKDTTGKTSIVIDRAHGTITIAAPSGITVRSDGGRLTLEGKGITIRSSSDVQVEAATSLQVKSAGPLAIAGAIVDIN
jgi:uncharacterized protein involved in type VI secretion and phage assembly